MDSGKAVVVTLLDLSAGFDTINHNMVFNCLRDWFRVDGTMLRRIKSYLSNCEQKVKLGNCFSDAFSLPYGVPKSSVLGPLLLTLYKYPIQIYLALDHRNIDFSFAELTDCLTRVQKWMDGVKLKLNPEETEFIIIGDRQARESLIQKYPQS